MNGIVKKIESDILIFAVDSSLFATDSDPIETVNQLNRDLEKIYFWSKEGKVTFNAKKKEFDFF